MSLLTHTFAPRKERLRDTQATLARPCAHANGAARSCSLSVPGSSRGSSNAYSRSSIAAGVPTGGKAGTGLGLSISRRLVEAMGGTIVAQSPALRWRGARFAVRLPAVLATPIAPSPAA